MSHKEQQSTEDKNWERFWVTQKLMLWNPETKKFLLAKVADSDFFKSHPEYDPWVRIGGHIDKGEDILSALRREVSEEAGDIQYEVIGLLQTTRWQSDFSVLYLAEYKGGEIVLDNKEHTEYDWFSADEIEKNDKFAPFLKETTRMAVERLKEREYLNDLKRLQADFENYRKRQEESKKELGNYLIEKLVMEIIPVLDNFQSATAHVPETSKSDPWVVGIQYIEKQLEDVLSSNGMQTIDVKVGDTFDPRLHEAISQTDEQTETEGTEKGTTIAKVLQKGYKLGERVIRPAKVVVS